MNAREFPASHGDAVESFNTPRRSGRSRSTCAISIDGAGARWVPLNFLIVVALRMHARARNFLLRLHPGYARIINRNNFIAS